MYIIDKTRFLNGETVSTTAMIGQRVPPVLTKAYGGIPSLRLPDIPPYVRQLS